MNLTLSLSTIVECPRIAISTKGSHIRILVFDIIRQLMVTIFWWASFHTLIFVVFYSFVTWLLYWLDTDQSINLGSALCFISSCNRVELETFWRATFQDSNFLYVCIFAILTLAVCRFPQDPMPIPQTSANYSQKAPWIHMLMTLMLLTRGEILFPLGRSFI